MKFSNLQDINKDVSNSMISIKESLSKSKMSISPESPTLTNLPLSIKLKNLDKKKLKIVEED